MSREYALERGRAAAEAGMTDTCTISKMVRGTVQDETTGKFPDVPTVIYTGPCEFKAAVYRAREIDAASQQLVEQDATIKLPVLESGAVGKDMVFVITSAQNDPALVGVTGRIKGPFVGSFTTARRFPVEVTT